MDTETLKKSLQALKYGEIATVAMFERGAYAEPEDNVEEAGASDLKNDTGIFKALAGEIQAADEDVLVVNRKDEDLAMTSEDFDEIIAQLSQPHHLIFVECLYLGTTEIKGFLNALKAKNVLADSKVILLDLPTLEYMMLRDSLSGQIEL